MIKIRIEGDYRECLEAADKIRRTPNIRIHAQSKFYLNRERFGGENRGRIYLDVEILN